ncbi:DHH family phosphoesterase [Anaeromicropila populeti]|uniref:Phosphoesterase RecJ domain-containing protein n=1 Tax=Anaeromicropila populeti TaxID=37658 RepID=A0A1I6JS13_9FIRM|nr:bifunctional oligoribonuclease/PAP phosphatase NrnA [Anaeromicropila populeti]SFR81743.1 phosphoesterase RecJ domain-containing protein [Anaeromicropila populeti]
MVKKINDAIEKADSIGIGGHIRPDGDCVGACLGFYYYLQTKFPEKTIHLYLEYVQDEFQFLKFAECILTEADGEFLEKPYDIFVSLDCGDAKRLGFSELLFHNARVTINIDHHVSNPDFAKLNYVLADASSTCEVLYHIIDKEYMDTNLAQALYTGIIHDTGVFKHSNTSRKTMEIAGDLMSYQIPFSKIIDETFYQKTYLQNQILGRCLLESMMILDGKCIVSSVSKKMMNFYGTTPKDLEGVIDQLRVTKDVEVAVLIHELDTQKYKISMRSNGEVNVSKIAILFGGGGHIKAAGCTLFGTLHDVINNIGAQLAAQLEK